MDVKEAIKTRHSVRKFLDKEVPQGLIDELIDAARLAPSGYNAQPWRFCVVKDKETKEKLFKEGALKQKFVKEAPVLIVCCGDPDAYRKNRVEKDFDDSEEVSVFRDVSIASGFLVLRATELGLGACYIAWRHKEKIKEVLGIPKNFYVPFIIIAGYPAEKPSASPRKKLSEIILK